MKAANRVNFVLWAMIAGFAAVIANELVAAVPNVAAANSSEAHLLPQPRLEPREPDFDALVEIILDRPLFSRDRRPPSPPPPQATEQAKPPELKARLAGMVVTPDDREALFAREHENPLSLRLGGTIDGWKVKDIDFDRVVLASPFGEETVEPTVGRRDEGAPPHAGQPPKPPRPAPSAVASKRGPPAAKSGPSSPVAARTAGTPTHSVAQ